MTDQVTNTINEYTDNIAFEIDANGFPTGNIEKDDQVTNPDITNMVKYLSGDWAVVQVSDVPTYQVYKRKDGDTFEMYPNMKDHNTINIFKTAKYAEEWIEKQL